jgi:hypothetical protein
MPITAAKFSRKFENVNVRFNPSLLSSCPHLEEVEQDYKERVEQLERLEKLKSLENMHDFDTLQRLERPKRPERIFIPDPNEPSTSLSFLKNFTRVTRLSLPFISGGCVGIFRPPKNKYLKMQSPLKTF